MSAEQPTHVGNPNNTHPWRDPLQSHLNSSPNLVDTNKVQLNVTVSVDLKDHVEHAEKRYKKYGHLAYYDNVVADHFLNGIAKATS